MGFRVQIEHFVNCVNQVAMAKSLIQAFDEDFLREVKQARNYPEAYERASEKFEKQHGFAAFDSYDSFRLKKSRQRKR